MNEQYLQNIYNYIISVDDSFEAKMTFDAFKEKMGSQQYAAKIYDYMGETDDTFKSKLGVVDFLDKVGTVKKKNLLKIRTPNRKILHRNRLQSIIQSIFLVLTQTIFKDAIRVKQVM